MPLRPNFLSRLLLAALLLAPPAWARLVEESSYHYPYRDPYLATTTIAIMKGREERWGDDGIRDLEAALIPGRDQVPLLEGKGRLRFRLYRNRGPAPLVVIVPGLGSSAYEGSASFVAESLVAGGFHVLVLPDPLNWNFALAASSSGIPGSHLTDAADMYRAIRAALRQARERQGLEVESLGLVGLSEGALCAAHVAKLDGERRELRFATTLLINPPLDPLEAIHKIDQMARLGATLTPEQRAQVNAYAFGTGMQALRQDYDDPDYFADWDERLRMNPTQIRYLIGAALFSAIGDTMYTIELAQHPGVLKTPVSAGFRSVRLDEARSIGLLGYLERFLLPRLRIHAPWMTQESLNAESSLRTIGPSLVRSRRVFLMHNRDDILLAPGDIDYLASLFGEQATIYPHGGHLGNLWYGPNRRDIVDHFRRHLGAEPATEELF